MSVACFMSFLGSPRLCKARYSDAAKIMSPPKNRSPTNGDVVRVAPVGRVES